MRLRNVTWKMAGNRPTPARTLPRDFNAAALVGEQGLIAAIAEERINRKKHCGGFPALAVAEVLRLGGARPEDLTDIAVARDPGANLGAKMAFLARNPSIGV